MEIWIWVLMLVILGTIAGHITHIMVTAVIFAGLRERIRRKGELRGGFWAMFSEGFHCHLCSGVWYSAVISLWWTVAIYIFRPDLWNVIAMRPLGWLNTAAWISLFLVQTFFIASIGHFFREIVGLLEDRRTTEEEEAEVLHKTIEQLEGNQSQADLDFP